MNKSMEKFQPDYYSYGILFILSEEGQSHFNQLHKTLNSRGISISKPTLSNHLKRLVKAGYVKREENEGVQLVTYTANWPEITRIKEYWKRAKTIGKFYGKNKKEFLSLSESEQVSIILNVWLEKKLNEIKANIAFRLDSENLDKGIAFMFWTSPLLDYAEHWLMEKCVEDEGYRRRVFKEIDKWLSRRKAYHKEE